MKVVEIDLGCGEWDCYEEREWFDCYFDLLESMDYGCSDDLYGLEPILFDEDCNRLIVRDENGWFFTVGVEREQDDHGSYWQPPCSGEWFVTDYGFAA